MTCSPEVLLLCESPSVPRSHLSSYLSSPASSLKSSCGSATSVHHGSPAGTAMTLNDVVQSAQVKCVTPSCLRGNPCPRDWAVFPQAASSSIFAKPLDSACRPAGGCCWLGDGCSLWISRTEPTGCLSYSRGLWWWKAWKKGRRGGGRRDGGEAERTLGIAASQTDLVIQCIRSGGGVVLCV